VTPSRHVVSRTNVVAEINAVENCVQKVEERRSVRDISLLLELHLCHDTKVIMIMMQVSAIPLIFSVLQRRLVLMR